MSTLTVIDIFGINKVNAILRLLKKYRLENIPNFKKKLFKSLIKAENLTICGTAGVHQWVENSKGKKDRTEVFWPRSPKNFWAKSADEWGKKPTDPYHLVDWNDGVKDGVEVVFCTYGYVSYTCTWTNDKKDGEESQIELNDHGYGGFVEWTKLWDNNKMTKHINHSIYTDGDDHKQIAIILWFAQIFNKPINPKYLIDLS